MTFRSSFRITLIAGALSACVSQYTSPGPEVESTSSEPSGDSSRERSEATSSADEASDAPREKRETPDEAKREPTEASGTCDDRSCVSTSDCCKGYECGFDPERSKVIRYCLAQ